MWRVTVEGFPSFDIDAPTRSKARAKAWHMYCDGWVWISFPDFWPLVVSIRRADEERASEG